MYVNHTLIDEDSRRNNWTGMSLYACPLKKLGLFVSSCMEDIYTGSWCQLIWLAFFFHKGVSINTIFTCNLNVYDALLTDRFRTAGQYSKIVIFFNQVGTESDASCIVEDGYEIMIKGYTTNKIDKEEWMMAWAFGTADRLLPGELPLKYRQQPATDTGWIVLGLWRSWQ